MYTRPDLLLWMCARLPNVLNALPHPTLLLIFMTCSNKDIFAWIESSQPCLYCRVEPFDSQKNIRKSFGVRIVSSESRGRNPKYSECQRMLFFKYSCKHPKETVLDGGSRRRVQSPLREDHEPRGLLWSVGKGVFAILCVLMHLGSAFVSSLSQGKFYDHAKYRRK